MVATELAQALNVDIPQLPLVPVSYTHLDVYKRQLHGCCHAGTHSVKADASGLMEALNDPPEHVLL